MRVSYNKKFLLCFFWLKIEVNVRPAGTVLGTILHEIDVITEINRAIKILIFVILNFKFYRLVCLELFLLFRSTKVINIIIIIKRAKGII